MQINVDNYAQNIRIKKTNLIVFKSKKIFNFQLLLTDENN